MTTGYEVVTSSSSLPDPTAALPGSSSVSQLLVSHVYCLHLLTHRLLLLVSLSLTGCVFLLFAIGIWRHWRRLQRRGARLPELLLSAFSSSSSPSSLLSPASSSFSSFFVSLLLCLISFLTLLLGSYYEWTLLHFPSPLLVSFLFLSSSACLFSLQAVKQYALLLTRSLPVPCPRLLSRPAFSRLYLSLLGFIAVVFCLSFLFLLLFLTLSAARVRAALLLTTVLLSTFSLSLTLLALAVYLQLLRKHVLAMRAALMAAQPQSAGDAAEAASASASSSLQSLLLLPSALPLTAASSSASNASAFSASSFASPSSPSRVLRLLSAHAVHVRNAQALLLVHCLLHLMLSLFILSSAQPRYHFMHGVFINALFTVITLTYAIAFSFPITAGSSGGSKGQDADDEDEAEQQQEEEDDDAAVGAGSLRSIREEEWEAAAGVTRLH